MLQKNLIFFIKKGAIAVAVVAVLVFLLRMLIALDSYFLFKTEGYLQWLVPVVGAIILYIIGSILVYRLKKMERLKSEFVTVVAHRLRTPLTRISWMVGGLEKEVTTQEGKILVSDAGKTIKELTGIVNQFLDAMEIGDDTAHNEYLFEMGSLAQIIRQALTDYSVGIQRKGLEMVINIKDDMPHVPLDKDRMRIAVGALLENAILYTPQGGKIEVAGVQENSREIGVEIVDNGIGISKEERPNLFSKFYRGKRATSVDPDRAGLGLFIAHEIVKKHGGEIEVGSLGTSHGSRFAIVLPIPK